MDYVNQGDAIAKELPPPFVVSEALLARVERQWPQLARLVDQAEPDQIQQLLRRHGVDKGK